MRRTVKTLSLMFATVLLQACGSDSSSYSILSSAESFKQNAEVIQTKIDILWVIDNSGSMATSQQNLVQNFDSFISNFVTKSYDFRMGVTTTDSFIARPEYSYIYNDSWNSYYQRNRYYFGLDQDLKAMLRSGVPGKTESGFKIITNSTPDIIGSFKINAVQGIEGYGDERALQSLRTTLESAHNADFRRPDAFLAIIIVSDEEDFSHDGTSLIENRNYAGLHTPQSYVDFLDAYTGTSGAQRQYSVSTISINDQACLDSLNIDSNVRKIGTRIGQVAQLTGGTIGNLCGDFANELKLIQDKILNSVTQFYLKREPIPETIRVIVNNQLVPRADQNGGEGWTYKADSMSIVFSEQFMPPQNAEISVSFDPVGLDF